MRKTKSSLSGSTADQIEIIITDEGSDIPRVKKTLNERFTFRD